MSQNWYFKKVYVTKSESIYYSANKCQSLNLAVSGYMLTESIFQYCIVGSWTSLHTAADNWQKVQLLHRNVLHTDVEISLVDQHKTIDSNDKTGTHCIVSKTILLNSFTYRTILYMRHKYKPWSMDWPKAGEDSVNTQSQMKIVLYLGMIWLTKS